MDAFSGEGEAPARVLPPRRFERRHGIRIERYAAAVARLRRAESANSTIGFMCSGKASINRSASSRLRNRTRRRGSFSIRIFGTPSSHRQS